MALVGPHLLLGEKLYGVFPSNLIKKDVYHQYVRLSPISIDEQKSPLESKVPPVKLTVNIVNEYPPPTPPPQKKYGTNTRVSSAAVTNSKVASYAASKRYKI
jgi:hypothetical protein